MNGEYWTQGRASHFGLKNIHSSGVWTKGKTMFSTTTTSDEAKFGNHAVSQLRGWVSLQSGQDVLERVKTLLWMMTRTSLFLLSLSFLSFFKPAQCCGFSWFGASCINAALTSFKSVFLKLSKETEDFCVNLHLSEGRPLALIVEAYFGLWEDMQPDCNQWLPIISVFVSKGHH